MSFLSSVVNPSGTFSVGGSASSLQAVRKIPHIITAKSVFKSFITVLPQSVLVHYDSSTAFLNISTNNVLCDRTVIFYL